MGFEYRDMTPQKIPAAGSGSNLFSRNIVLAVVNSLIRGRVPGLKEAAAAAASDVGLLIPVIVVLIGGIYPIGGDFYPADEKWSSFRLRKQLGLIGLGSWISVAALSAV